MAGNQVDIVISAVEKGVKQAFGGLQQNIKTAKTALETFNTAMGRTNKAAGALSGRLKAAFAGIGTGVVVRQLWDAGVAMERFRLAYEATARSAKGGAQELAWVREEANRLGLSFQTAAEGYKQVYAAGQAARMPLEQTRLIFTGIAEASMALGLSNEQTEGTMRAIYQMLGKQKVTAEELRQQLGERLPTAVADFAEAAGVSLPVFSQMMEQGKVSIDTVYKTMELWSKRYGAKALEAADGPIGALGRWKTAWFDLKLAVADSGFLDEASKNLRRLTDYITDPAVKESIRVWAERFWDVVGAVTELVWKYKGWIVAAGGTVLVTSMIGKLVTTAVALHKAFVVLTGMSVATWLQTVAGSMNATAIAAAGLRGALAAMSGMFAALWVGWEVGKLLNEFDIVKKAAITAAHTMTMTWTRAKLAWAKLFSSEETVAALERDLRVYQATYDKMMAEFGQVKKKGTEAHRAVADAAEDSAQQQGEASSTVTQQMADDYKRYTDAVKRLQDEIANGERSLAEQLRAMQRTGMSEIGAWRDRRREAQEFYNLAKKASAEAERAAAAGDTDRALQLAEQAREMAAKAKDAAAELNTEIKNGDQVILSQQQALKVAYAEVKKYGELELDIQRKMAQFNQDAADRINKDSGYAFVKKDLAEITEATDKYARITVPALGKSYELVWDNAAKEGKAMIREVDQATDEMINKKRTMVIDVKMRQDGATKHYGSWEGAGYDFSTNRLGGLIGRAARLAFGGLNVRNAMNGFYFPGYGGGDRPGNLVMAEDGEVMIRKEMVKRAGLTAALAFNAGRWDVLLAELLKRFSLPGLVSRQLGGLIAPLRPAVTPLPMAAGGAVGPAAAREMIDITLTLPTAGRPVRGSFGRAEARELIRQLKHLERGSA